MQISKNILVAPLNWGLGHATRCIPIIQSVIDSGNNPIIASDGKALELLKQEFPKLTFIELPSYGIQYPENGQHFKLKMLKDSPKIWNAIRKEHKILQSIIYEYQLDGIISDNRLGLYTTQVVTVFITHQLQVFSGSTTWLSTQLHLHFIKKFDYCWIPDHDGFDSLSGKLSRSTSDDIEMVYLGPLSRFNSSTTTDYKYKLLVVLSGPEPQRGLLERKLLKELKNYPEKVLFVAGNVQEKQITEKKGNITYYNYLSTEGLQKAFNRSEVVLSRSGYSTIMDLDKLEKKAYFIPTPGQYEQEYLAAYLQEKGVAPFSHQDNFKISDLEKIANYSGFKRNHSEVSTSISSIVEGTFSNVNENSDPIPNSLST